MSVLIGGRQITAADVHSIATAFSSLLIDGPALEATKRRAADLLNAEANKSKGGKGKGGAAAESKSAEPSTADPSSLPPSITDASNALSISESRAIMTVKLAQILEGRSGIRADVATYLAALLNNKISPLLPRSSNDRILLQHIAALLFPLNISGSRFVRVGDQLISYQTALQQTPSIPTPPTLNNHDYSEFLSGVAPSVGLLSLEFSAFASYVPLADVIAALTLETISAHTEPFSQDHHEVARPHKGSKEVAANLRWLLENSKFAGSAKRTEQDPAVFRSIPHYHGPARDALDHAARVVRVELHAAELTPAGTSSRHAGPFHPAPINSAAAHLTLVALQLANYSAQRSQELLQNGSTYGLPASLLPPTANAEKNDGALPDWSSLLTSVQNKIEGVRAAMESLHKPSTSDASSILSVLRKANDALLESLSFESLITNQALAILNDEAVAASEAAQAKKEAAAKKREEELKAAGKPIPAQAPRPKEIKGIQLGNGTAKWRSFLTSTVAAPGSSTGIGAFQLIQNQQSAQRILSSLIAAFDAFGTLSSSVSAEVERLLASANQKSKPKIARGTRDSEPEQITIREKCFSIIRSVFLKHGAVGIDTPVFELRETLMGKYGEDSKLIYDLADQGGEALSLRYDLTVPFARYVAMHQADHIKRYHIAKVYRRDNPAMARGRFREFYQCDLDIAGNYAPMVPDAEVLKVLVDILDQLQVGGYAVKLNHRNLLDGLMEICGVPAEKFRAICSSIDKLDKESWSDVREEMVVKKGLSAESADKIGKYVVLKAETGNPLPLLNDLKSRPEFASNERAQKAFSDLALLFDYLEDLGALSRISFDMSLARGLDYYTGVIYEAVLTDTDRVGSIAAGGRYDNLVGMFSSKQVPAVGVSIGIERLLTILEELERKRGAIRKNATHVLVCSAGKNLLRERMKLANKLWESGVNAEYLYDANPRADRQMEYALENYIPITVWIGEDELKKGVVGVRNMRNREQNNIENAKLMTAIRELLQENERLGPMPIYVPEKKEKGEKAEAEKKE